MQSEERSSAVRSAPVGNKRAIAGGGTLVPSYLDENENWGLDVNNLRQSVAQARAQGITVRAMVIINPGNPIGQCLSETNLREILRFCCDDC